ncbi:orotate phosphoribosyltransferase [Methanomicrobium sp. W14]|uniref:orotate phosphoribosyltransferase n=1 Tax=Methanomicrobium sp. W14 TaxID=2817839 RepID=UPI001AE762DC|nr:orotate phosphoribosyltransferase [Methanomicrobium sp. W14]MBP2132277.1 orotate phosphoribosyltransferase [Methanomicrobium sp. W14]
MVSEIADILIKYGAIEFGDFTLASGAKSTYYIDIKTASTNPALLSAIGSEIAKIAEKFDFDVIAGVAVGAVPIAVSVSLSSKKPYCIIRKEKKDHGISDNIIGDVKGKHVLLVEDVVTSGGSVIYGIEQLRKAGATADTVVAVVDREQGGCENLKKNNTKLYSLVRASEILNKSA